MTENLKELPTVRIQKVVLENFKSVEYGEMEMACGKKFVPYDTQSDILGIYGQNGSGKTSMIEALAILEYLNRACRPYGVEWCYSGGIMIRSK